MAFPVVDPAFVVVHVAGREGKLAGNSILVGEVYENKQAGGDVFGTLGLFGYTVFGQSPSSMPNKCSRSIRVQILALLHFLNMSFAHSFNCVGK